MLNNGFLLNNTTSGAKARLETRDFGGHLATCVELLKTKRGGRATITYAKVAIFSAMPPRDKKLARLIGLGYSREEVTYGLQPTRNQVTNILSRIGDEVFGERSWPKSTESHL